VTGGWSGFTARSKKKESTLTSLRDLTEFIELQYPHIKAELAA
jgi:hypothetical protein